MLFVLSGVPSLWWKHNILLCYNTLNFWILLLLLGHLLNIAIPLRHVLLQLLHLIGVEAFTILRMWPCQVGLAVPEWVLVVALSTWLHALCCLGVASIG